MSTSGPDSHRTVSPTCVSNNRVYFVSRSTPSTGLLRQMSSVPDVGDQVPSLGRVPFISNVLVVPQYSTLYDPVNRPMDSVLSPSSSFCPKSVVLSSDPKPLPLSGESIVYASCPVSDWSYFGRTYDSESYVPRSRGKEGGLRSTWEFRSLSHSHTPVQGPEHVPCLCPTFPRLFVR